MVYPLMGMVPQSTHTPLCWTALVKFIARQSKLWQGKVFIGVSDNVQLCSFLNCHQSMGRVGGVIIGKYFYSFFTCFWVYWSFLSNKSFLQEKNGNILVGGYSPPLIGKRPIYFRFFLMKASLSVTFFLSFFVNFQFLELLTQLKIKLLPITLWWVWEFLLERLGPIWYSNYLCSICTKFVLVLMKASLIIVFEV